MIHFIFASNHRPISLNPAQSDSLINHAHMLHLVGTLVSEVESGKFSPNLASSWSIESDHRVYRFVLRPGLHCEDGEEITPITFKRSFEQSLRRYSQNAVPVFQNLLGFDDFKRGGNLSGLRVYESELVFEFERPIKTGLLEFLSMSYYGYYASQNFDQSGRWKDDERIISSGSYKLSSIDIKDRRIEIEARPEWYSVEPTSPRKVVIEQRPLDLAFRQTKQTIVFKFNDQPMPCPAKFREIAGPAEMLVALVVSNEIDNLFCDAGNRRTLFARLRRAQAQTAYPGENRELTEFIYPQHAATLSALHAAAKFQGKMDRPLRVVLTDSLDEGRVRYIKTLLDLIFQDTDVTYETETLSTKDPDWFQNFTANNYYDLRVAGVNAGHEFQSWVVNMMFGSKLGVSFPDPSGRVTKLMHEFESSSMTTPECVQRMNQIIHEDQAVIPLFHGRYSWYVSSDIKLENDAVMVVPRFEHIRF